MLGGTTIVDTNGTILWVDRPFGGTKEFFTGRNYWDFAGDDTSRHAKALFAWTLAMGESTEGVGSTGGEIPSRKFRFSHERLNVSHAVILCRFAPFVDANLTATESAICEFLVRDYRAEEIASAISISVNTVQTHRRNILHKVGVRGIAGLTRWWEERERWKHG